MIDFKVNEYEWQAVPMESRISIWRLMIVWFSAPFMITTAMIGAILTLKMGFKPALHAILIGNLCLFIYISFLGVLSMQRGMNLSLQLSVTYGRLAARWFTLLVSLVMLGWLAVQAGFITECLVSVLHSSPSHVIAVTVISMLVITIFGIRSVPIISLTSIILFVLVSIYVVFDIGRTLSLSTVWHYRPLSSSGHIEFFTAISMVIACWIAGATANADFNRWAKSEKHVVLSVFMGFPLSSSLAMIVGSFIVAGLSTISVTDALSSGNLFVYLTNKNIHWLTNVSVIFLFCNIGSICIHNLYNAASEFCHLTKIPFQPMVIIICLFTTFFSLVHGWHYIISLVSAIGVVIPPIGAVVIADQMFVRSYPLIQRDCRIGACFSWSFGMLVAIYATYIHSFFIPSLFGIFSSGLFYYAWESVKQFRGYYEL